MAVLLARQDTPFSGGLYLPEAWTFLEFHYDRATDRTDLVLDELISTCAIQFHNKIAVAIVLDIVRYCTFALGHKYAAGVITNAFDSLSGFMLSTHGHNH